jgi:hypothetical protein
MYIASILPYIIYHYIVSCYYLLLYCYYIVEGSLEVKLPTIWTDEKPSWAEAERRGE